MTNAALVYLYGVVAAGAPEPPAALSGVDGGAVRLLPAGPIAAVVGDVAAADYAEGVLDVRLRDVEWVGARGVAHERVLTWFADRGPVVPLTLFSLHRSEARLRDRLTEREAHLQSALRRLEGRREWGVKLWRVDAAFAAGVTALSEPLRTLDAELESTTPGRRFLLTRKRDALRADEGRRVSADVVQRVFVALRDAADEARALPIPPPDAASRERALVLHAAFLVSESGFDAFQARLRELAAELQPSGFDWEFTGPWPAYRFVAF